MPQITFDPLPVLKEGEGLEENDNVTINIVDEHNSWTVVKRNKKNKKKKDTASEKWNKQQKENFEKFGDIWYQEPYENYRVADHDTPAAQAPQPQAQVQQQPVLQQQPAGLPQPPVLPPQQPVAVPPQLLHQRYKNVASKPFQKTTKLLDHDVQKSRLRTFLRLKALREAAHLKHWISWDDEDEKILIQILMNDLETYLKN